MNDMMEKQKQKQKLNVTVCPNCDGRPATIASQQPFMLLLIRLMGDILPTLITLKETFLQSGFMVKESW
jgi:hypothetical protein